MSKNKSEKVIIDPSLQRITLAEKIFLGLAAVSCDGEEAASAASDRPMPTLFDSKRSPDDVASFITVQWRIAREQVFPLLAFQEAERAYELAQNALVIAAYNEDLLNDEPVPEDNYREPHHEDLKFNCSADDPQLLRRAEAARIGAHFLLDNEIRAKNDAAEMEGGTGAQSLGISAARVYKREAGLLCKKAAHGIFFNKFDAYEDAVLSTLKTEIGSALHVMNKPIPEATILTPDKIMTKILINYERHTEWLNHSYCSAGEDPRYFNDPYFTGMLKKLAQLSQLAL